MSATPLLRAVLQAMQKHGLEAILIGNAGAAIHGAPVTTIDFDFMFRDTPDNMRKLKAVAKELKAVILRPYYPVRSCTAWWTTIWVSRSISCRWWMA